RGSGRLRPLSARGRREQEDRREGGRGYATHCQSAHCTIATPRSIELIATSAVCMRGRPPSAARARKNGKTTSPNRGSESSGQRELGTLSGIARLSAANSPYGAPKRLQATTVSTTKSARKARLSRLTAAACIGAAPGTPAPWPVKTCCSPCQPARSPCQSPPSGPAGETCRCHWLSALLNAQGSPTFAHRTSG